MNTEHDHWNKKEEAELIRIELMYGHEMPNNTKWFNGGPSYGTGFEEGDPRWAKDCEPLRPFYEEEIDDARDEAQLDAIYEYEERGGENDSV